jgi:hypothetical protein
LPNLSNFPAGNKAEWKKKRGVLAEKWGQKNEDGLRRSE